MFAEVTSKVQISHQVARQAAASWVQEGMGQFPREDIQAHKGDANKTISSNWQPVFVELGVVHSRGLNGDQMFTQSLRCDLI